VDGLDSSMMWKDAMHPNPETRKWWEFVGKFVDFDLFKGFGHLDPENITKISRSLFS